jgi:hypothetical protein
MTKLIVAFSSCLKAPKFIQAISVGKAEHHFALLLNKLEMTNYSYLKLPVLVTERLTSPIAFHVDPEYYAGFTTKFSLL